MRAPSSASGVTTAVSSPGSTTRPERVSVSSAPGSGSAAGLPGSPTSGSIRRIASIRCAPTCARVSLSTASAATRRGITRKAA